MNLDKIMNYGDLGELLSSDMLPILDSYPEFDSKFLMEKEYELFGFYVSNHPVTSYKKKYGSTNLSLMNSYFDKFIDVIIYVDRIKVLDTKKGEKMCFITGSDETCSIDVVLFPKVYDESISVHDILYLTGKVEKRHGEFQLVVSKIKEIIK